MDVPLDDVYLTGKLSAEISRAQASERLAQLFKSTPATMLGLLTGKPQILKRGVDKNTALKYREALQQAGVEAAFKAQTVAPDSVVTTPTPVTNNEPAAGSPESSLSGLSLAPLGADVLAADERKPVIAPAIDVHHLSLAEPGSLLEAVQIKSMQPKIAEIPATDHLSLAASGSDLLTTDERTQIPTTVPDTSNLSLAAEGTILETLHDVRAAVQVDISQLSLAPSGADLLTPEQRNKTTTAAPNTDHIKLAN
jgi:hypothetical protein